MINLKPCAGHMILRWGHSHISWWCIVSNKYNFWHFAFLQINFVLLNFLIEIELGRYCFSTLYEYISSRRQDCWQIGQGNIFLNIILCFQYYLRLRHGRQVRCPHLKTNGYCGTNEQWGQTCLSSLSHWSSKTWSTVKAIV